MNLQDIIGQPAPPGTKLTENAMQFRVHMMQGILQFILDEIQPAGVNGILQVPTCNGTDPQFAWIPSPTKPAPQLDPKTAGLLPGNQGHEGASGPPAPMPSIPSKTMLLRDGATILNPAWVHWKNARIEVFAGIIINEMERCNCGKISARQLHINILGKLHEASNLQA